MNVYVAIADPSDDIDAIRYEHHLRHRGQDSHRLFRIFWWSVTAFLVLNCTIGCLRWWSRKIFRTHRYERLTPMSNVVYFARPQALFNAITLKPSPRLLGFTVTTYSLGKTFILASFAVGTLSLLALIDAPIPSSYFLDDVALRAAWITLTQIPLVYLLSTRRGPLNFVTGLSHTRINWLHRWVGRLVLLSATIHVAIMKSSILTENLLRSHDQGIAVVRYGIMTYTVLVWIAISSILPLRRRSYRVFYINHYTSTLVFLAIAFQHVPTYARPAIYLASFILFLDKLVVAYCFLRNNISISAAPRRFRHAHKLIAGYPVRMITPSASVSSLPAQTASSTTIIRIAHVPFPSRPGQHIRLSIPSLGILDSHPFTPADCTSIPPPPLPPRRDIQPGQKLQQSRQTSELLLFVKAKVGFTRRLADYHASWLARPCPNASSPPGSELKAYIDGPYGCPPKWEEYEHLVLVGSETGLAFSLAILDYLEQLCFTSPSHLRMATQRISLLWIRRHIDPGFEDVVRERVTRCAATLRDFGLEVNVEGWTTCPESREGKEVVELDRFAHLRGRCVSVKPELRIRHPDEIYDEWDREAEEMLAHAQPFEEDQDGDGRSDDCTLVDGKNSDEWTIDSNSEDGDDPFSDHNLLQDDAYRPLPVPAPPPPPLSVRQKGCDCAIIQHQRRKLNRGKSAIEEKYGARPDVRNVLLGLGLDKGGKCMVAICANRGVVRDVRDVVSRLEMDLAMGRGGKERGRVEVWTESQE
ncbi:hypothetical protein BDU57DRAFT_452977 [Ampelomyces quisqualis]|uniref:FAD-binding FR-type domain-containing protein n=1 Tax=Ampelomyces quisqualis TaxID=50730 RepID=A0A6A5QJ55_AMPQU|nr:hypothetical protein BDU57DRAFT_452977 [Ampelomyces quisqualis]